MTRDTELTLNQVTEVIRALPRRRSGTAPDVTYLADGLLWCALCGARLTVEPAEGWYADPHGAAYACAECGRTRARVTTVHQELRELVRRRLADPAVIVRWRSARLAALTAELAQLRAVLVWGRDERHCARLGRALHLGAGPFGRAAVEAGLGHLDTVATRLVELVTEYAALTSGPERGRTRHIGELRAARLAFSDLYFPLLQLGHQLRGTLREQRRRTVRALGGRREYAAYQAELHAARLPLWDLLAHPDWYAPQPAKLPAHDEALARDWSRDPTREPGRRRKLLLTALGEDRLTLGPATADGPRLHLVPAPADRAPAGNPEAP
ncbi:hypothetical protein [Streptomyces sp. G45]|uniref:hypothetical protein n=1 Tax=Streptomyces sp. G45 TaxID=3406627 RepID=UPI003C29B49C